MTPLREVSREEPSASEKAGGDSGGGGRSELEMRLRRVEIQLAGIDNQLKHVATKAWVLGGVLGGMGIAASVGVAIVMIFLRVS